MNCDVCHAENLNHVILCDETMLSYCPPCHSVTDCGLGAHGEGCPTQVFEDDPVTAAFREEYDKTDDSGTKDKQ